MAIEDNKYYLVSPSSDSLENSVNFTPDVFAMNYIQPMTFDDSINYSIDVFSMKVVGLFPHQYTYTGNGAIGGVATIKSVICSGAKVILYSDSNNQYVAETTTDATGAFMFSNINENMIYNVMVKEPSGAWEYLVQSRVVPAIQ